MKTIKITKQNFAQNLLSENKNKSQILWNHVNKLCNKTLQNAFLGITKPPNLQIVIDKIELYKVFV